MVLEFNTITGFLSATCLLFGSFLCISGGIGILRFPDFYSRMHAVGVTDTLAAGMILVGLMLQSPDSFIVIKLLMILLMTLFINPTASHALAKAAIRNSLMPKVDIEKDSEEVIEEVNEKRTKTASQKKESESSIL